MVHFKLKFYVNNAHFSKVLYWSWLQTDLFFFTFTPHSFSSPLLSCFMFLSHILLSSPPISIFHNHLLYFLFSLPLLSRLSLSIMFQICPSHHLIFRSLILFTLSPSLSACHFSSVSLSFGICFSFSLLVCLGVGPFWPFLFHWPNPRNQEAADGVITPHSFFLCFKI